MNTLTTHGINLRLDGASSKLAYQAELGKRELIG